MWNWSGEVLVKDENFLTIVEVVHKKKIFQNLIQKQEKRTVFDHTEGFIPFMITPNS